MTDEAENSDGLKEIIVTIDLSQYPALKALKPGMSMAQVRKLIQDSDESTPAFMKRWESHDYPHDRMIDGEILPHGELYCYISSTYLNGFINYVKPIKAFVMNRYRSETVTEENMGGNTSLENEELEAKLALPGPGIWKDVKTQSKLELMEYVKQSNSCHTKLDIFQDDIHILAESDVYYWYFWFDMDSSDCCIGRLRKKGIKLPSGVVWSGDARDLEDIDKDVLLAEFTDYINGLYKDADNEAGVNQPPIEWPIDKMGGWMSFL